MPVIVPKSLELASGITLAEERKYYMLNRMETPQNTKKVLLVITKTNFGGAQRYVFELATALRAHGYSVAVAGGNPGLLMEKLGAAGIETFTIAGAQRDIDIVKEFTALRSLYTIIKDYNPDIIHLNSSKMGVLGSLIARLCGVPKIVFTAHGWPFFESRPWWWKIMAWSGSYLTTLLAHQTIVVSRHDLRHAAMPGVRSKLTHIYPSIEDFPTSTRENSRSSLLSEKAGLHSHHIWLGAVGELTRNKNHTTAIDAVAEFNENHTTKVVFCIIGEGELRRELEEQIELRGMRDYIFLVGQKDNARQYLPAFDMFLMPSLKEGLPYSLLEAGSLGLPCIVSFVGGLPEVVRNLDTGLVVDPHNHMTMVHALDYLLTHPTERTSYGEKLRVFVRDTFSPRIMNEATIAVYENHQPQ